MKPMLAATLERLEDFNDFPVYAQPKLDGIRCIIMNGKVLSRTLKPIPNRYIREILSGIKLPYILDGELLLEDSTATFQDVTSAVMSRGGRPEFIYHIFDVMDPILSHSMRVAKLVPFMMGPELSLLNFSSLGFEHHDRLRLVPTAKLLNAAELLMYEDLIINNFKYEGIILRKINGAYKCGRSTLKEGLLLKYKPFEDDEATVIGYTEEYTNTNAKEVSELGYTKRSSEQAGMIPLNTLGALVVEHPKWGQFNIGTGFTVRQRKDIWNRRIENKGAIVKFKYQKFGMKDKPRTPVFLGFRKD